MPVLTAQSAYLGFPDENDILVNHLHLILKISLYTNRSKGILNYVAIIKKIENVYNTETRLTYLNEHLKIKNTEKWARISSFINLFKGDNKNSAYSFTYMSVLVLSTIFISLL